MASLYSLRAVKVFHSNLDDCCAARLYELDKYFILVKLITIFNHSQEYRQRSNFKCLILS